MPTERGSLHLSRRSWLAGVLALGGSASSAADPAPADDHGERQAVEERAREAGLKGFRAATTDHYLGLGDGQLACGCNHRVEVPGGVAVRQVAVRVRCVGMDEGDVGPDGALPEIVERPDHPWFVGVQFHPELKSKPFDPHPLFASFIEAAVKQSRLV